MTVLAWSLVLIWALIFLAAGRAALRPLPEPAAVCPPYTLWLPEPGAAPTLSPAPSAVHRGSEPPPGDGWILRLCGGVQVAPDLPGRLAATGSDFVSVFPVPNASLLGAAVERAHRTFGGLGSVLDVRSPAGFADERVAFFQAADLKLDGVGEAPVLRMARARKAHLLPVDLRAGWAATGIQCRAPALSLSDHRAGFSEWVDGDSIVKVLATVPSLLLCLLPFVCLLFEPEIALLALGLAAASRLMAAVRDRFGWAEWLVGFVTEPLVALTGLASTAQREVSPPGLPALPQSAAPVLTGAKNAPRGGLLDRAGLLFLARRQGGSSVVMEWIYQNRPGGVGRLGVFIDRLALASASARAARFRRLAVADLAGQVDGALLSVPCGGAGDAARITARSKVLIDPDPAARRYAAAACPDARVENGTVEACPIGPFATILYIGLSEYLSDEMVLRQLEGLRGRLADGGVLITSTTLAHAEQNKMGKWLGWETRARSVAALRGLLDRAGYEVLAERTDPIGLQAVLRARSRPTA